MGKKLTILVFSALFIVFLTLAIVLPLTIPKKIVPNSYLKISFSTSKESNIEEFSPQQLTLQGKRVQNEQEEIFKNSTDNKVTLTTGEEGQGEFENVGFRFDKNYKTVYLVFAFTANIPSEYTEEGRWCFDYQLDITSKDLPENVKLEYGLVTVDKLSYKEMKKIEFHDEFIYSLTYTYNNYKVPNYLYLKLSLTNNKTTSFNGELNINVSSLNYLTGRQDDL